MNLCLSSNTFQSHFGLILTNRYNYIQNRWYLISIPFWSDFNIDCDGPCGAHVHISIPFWSDFNQDILWGCSSEHHTFQSHFGLILTDLSRYKFGTSRTFQSHFGLILTVLCHPILCNITKISIPFWSDFNSPDDLRFGYNPSWFQSHFGLILT